MKQTVDTQVGSKCSGPEQELTEEQFLEQFAALEESLALLQTQMRRLSENADGVRKTRRSSEIPTGSRAFHDHDSAVISRF